MDTIWDIFFFFKHSFVLNGVLIFGTLYSMENIILVGGAYFVFLVSIASLPSTKDSRNMTLRFSVNETGVGMTWQFLFFFLTFNLDFYSFFFLSLFILLAALL